MQQPSLVTPPALISCILHINAYVLALMSARFSLLLLLPVHAHYGHACCFAASSRMLSMHAVHACCSFYPCMLSVDLYAFFADSYWALVRNDVPPVQHSEEGARL